MRLWTRIGPQGSILLVVCVALMFGACESSKFESAPTVKAPPAAETSETPTENRTESRSGNLPANHPPVGGQTSRAPGDRAAPTDRAKRETPRSKSRGQKTEFPVEWSVPDGWNRVEVSSQLKMPKIKFRIPGPEQAATLNIFYFGPDKGGSVEANLKRWRGQFDEQKAVDRYSATVGDISVELIDIRGTFAPSMPMRQDTEPRPNTRMLAAIATVKGKNVFLKMVGPTETVAAVKPDFEAFIDSLEPSGSR